MKCKTRQEAELRYGKIQDGKWADEAKHMAMFLVPAEISQVLINSATSKPCTKIYCNKDIHEPLKQAFKNLVDGGLTSELKTFDGCFQIRMVRGSTTAMSAHSYALAIDFNAKENGLGVEPKLSAAFVKCFTDAGFSWGGNFSRKDGMHFSFCWE